MSSNKISNLAILSALLVSGGVLWYLIDGSEMGGEIGTQSENLKASAVLAENVASSLREATLVMKKSDGQNIYTHQSPKFSFKYPKTMRIAQLPTGGGESVTLQSENGELGMQVSVSSFDENITLTIKRVKQDLPDLPMRDATEFSLAGTKGVTFVSENMREVWLVRSGFLYQISAFAGQEELLSNIFFTWSW